MPTGTGMLCNINGDTIYSFTKNTCIDDSGTFCHITNDDTNLCNMTDIYKSIQGSTGSIPAINKVRLCINVCKIDGTEWVHTLCPVKFSPMTGAKLFSLTCKLLQGNKIPERCIHR